jgi:hypothetical protein
MRQKIKFPHFSETRRTCFPAMSTERLFLCCSGSFGLFGLRIACTLLSVISDSS